MTVPSAVPTVDQTRQHFINATFVVSVIRAGGSFARTLNNTHYFVNSIAEVVISGGGGVALYSVAVNRDSVLRIGVFNASSDVIDLSAFPDIQSMRNVSMSAASGTRSHLRRRLVVDAVNGSLDLNLGSGQYIFIANLTQTDLQATNFIFAPPCIPSASENTKTTTWTLTVMLEVAGCTVIVLFVLLKAGTVTRHYLHSMKLSPLCVDFEKAAKSSRTYMSFNELPHSDSEWEGQDDEEDEVTDSDDESKSSHSSEEEGQFSPPQLRKRRKSADAVRKYLANYHKKFVRSSVATPTASEKTVAGGGNKVVSRAHLISYDSSVNSSMLSSVESSDIEANFSGANSPKDTKQTACLDHDIKRAVHHAARSQQFSSDGFHEVNSEVEYEVVDEEVGEVSDSSDSDDSSVEEK
eukprot:gene35146-43330_t